MRCNNCKFFLQPVNDGKSEWELFGNCTLALPRWVSMENGSKVVTFTDGCDLGIKNEVIEDDSYGSIRQ